MLYIQPAYIISRVILSSTQDPTSSPLSPLPIAMATSEVDSIAVNYSHVLQDVDDTTLGLLYILLH